MTNPKLKQQLSSGHSSGYVVRPSIAYLLLVVYLVSLSRCVTVGPDYVPPEIDWVDIWETELVQQIGDREPNGFDLRFWWLLFEDPVLNDLIYLARKESPTLEVAGLRILEARAALGLAEGFRYPQSQRLTGAIDYVNRRQSGESIQTDITPRASFNVGWELDFWGKYARGIQAAEAGYFGSIAAQQDVQILLTASLADFYFAYRTTLLRISIARRNSEIQNRSFEITTLLFENGQQSEIDLQQAKTQYLATLSTIPALEITARQLRNAIGLLMGRPPGALSELDEDLRDLPVMSGIALQDVPAQALLRRPDIRLAATQIAFQTAQVGIAEADKYPSISLTGNVGFSGSTISLGIGPSLTWNIFNYGRIENVIRIEDARLQQLIENFQVVALQAAREIDDAAISIVKTREQRLPQRESYLAAQRTLELANTRYIEGYGDFQRVIDAQRAVARTAEQELLTNSAHVSAVIGFYKAMGGGWVDMPIDDIVSDSTRSKMERRTDWADLLRKPLPLSSDTLSVLKIQSDSYE